MKARTLRYRRLSATAIHESLVRLQNRILERFPESGLLGVCAEFATLSGETAERVAEIRRPIYSLRLAVSLLVVITVGVVVAVPVILGRWGDIKTTFGFINVLEPALGALFFLTAFMLFLLSLEARAKRRRALAALHELRALAHVIDMHQLTKDPGTLLGERLDTPSSPKRGLTPFLIGRYFDYCSEMLSLISKVAALYVQDFHDHIAISAVDEIETLTTGLSRKIWQKLMVLHDNARAGRPSG